MADIPMTSTAKASNSSSGILAGIRENWFYWLVLIFLLIFPFLVGWLTGDSPFGTPRGDRMVMRGESVYAQSILINVFGLAVLVMSYNLMFGFTGVISFGHALFFGLGGYLMGIILEFGGMDPNIALVVSLLVVLLVTGVIGFFIGIVSLRLRGIYFAIFTLAIAEMGWLFFRGLPLTNGEDGLNVASLPEWIDPSRNRIAVYYVGLALFVFAFLLIRRLVNSPVGSVFQAIRENEERAQVLGYNTLRYKLFSITTAGMLAGLAGMLLAIMNKEARPEILNVGVTVDALLMTIIGGVGTFTGPVIGAGGMHLLENFLREAVITIGPLTIDIGERWQLILGFIFVLVVLVFPYGVVGTWQRLRTRFSRKVPD
ncbi:branched-chain amino acid ABC transporter permease [Phototrophicus methaneseepsis]|uniref:Branched-chain amino acid ABC transporter permease n=1 Tax=Phototrophicus methaneseepsis TaxID=2710758 RepID=A0A7S8E7S3_9CHLR|nr:branched-chain amino acid ABC transporter permease [Phototrophicus methaneseepsis]QPC81955.1 branched-chain amino acid ABC transporter permease [Phototrophicus methaneseepsis]